MKRERRRAARRAEKSFVAIADEMADRIFNSIPDRYGKRVVWDLSNPEKYEAHCLLVRYLDTKEDFVNRRRKRNTK